MQQQLFSGNIHICSYKHTQVDVYWRREMTSTQTYSPLILLAQTHIYLEACLLLALPELLPLRTQTSSYLLVDDDRHFYTPTYLRLIVCTNTHSSFTLTEGVSLTRTQHYPPLAYLFHQCGASLLSRDGRILDCIVRHPVVEHPFSS